MIGFVVLYVIRVIRRPCYIVQYIIVIIIIITRDQRAYTGNWNGMMDVRDREIDSCSGG